MTLDCGRFRLEDDFQPGRIKVIHVHLIALLLLLITSPALAQNSKKPDEALFKDALRETIRSSMNVIKPFMNEKGVQIHPAQMALDTFDRHFNADDRTVLKDDLQLLLGKVEDFINRRKSPNSPIPTITKQEWIDQGNRELVFRLNTAFDRELIVPRGERREAILAQANELIETAQRMLIGLFPQHNPKQVKQHSLRLLKRNLTRIDDPLSNVLKQPLTDDELSELLADWSEIKIHKNPMPNSLANIPASPEFQRIQEESQIFRTAGDFHMAWTLMYRINRDNVDYPPSVK